MGRGQQGQAFGRARPAAARGRPGADRDRGRRRRVHPELPTRGDATARHRRRRPASRAPGPRLRVGERLRRDGPLHRPEELRLRDPGAVGHGGSAGRPGDWRPTARAQHRHRQSDRPRRRAECDGRVDRPAPRARRPARAALDDRRRTVVPLAGRDDAARAARHRRGDPRAAHGRRLPRASRPRRAPGADGHVGATVPGIVRRARHRALARRRALRDPRRTRGQRSRARRADRCRGRSACRSRPGRPAAT